MFYIHVFNFYVFDISQLLVLLFNLIVFVDMYLTIRNPFLASERRAKGYYIIILFTIISGLVLTTFKVLENQRDLKAHKFIKKIFFVVGCVISVPMLIISVLVMIRLRRPGTSNDLKRTVWKRHILYLFFYVMYSSKYLWANRNLINNDDKHNEIYYLANTFNNLFGIPLALVRLSEPYVYYIFKKEVLKRCCKKRKMEKTVNKIQEESLYSFLNSALNIEYVYVIL